MSQDDQSQEEGMGDLWQNENTKEQNNQYLVLCNSKWIEWSTIQEVFAQVIPKSDECVRPMLI